MVTHKAVPPTAFYYAARAELHRQNAIVANAAGDYERYLQQMTQVAKYTELAMQMDFDQVYDNHTEETV